MSLIVTLMNDARTAHAPFQAASLRGLCRSSSYYPFLCFPYGTRLEISVLSPDIGMKCKSYCFSMLFARSTAY